MAQKLDFYQRADKLGHSRERLQAGETIHSLVQIPDIDALRNFFDEGMSAAEREQMVIDLFGHLPETDPESDGSARAILSRVYAFLFGNTPLHPLDRTRTARLFPMSIDATSALNETVNTRKDLGTGGTMAYVNYETLTLESGGYFIIYNKPLTFKVDTLIRNGGGTNNFYDINIYGATGAAGPGGKTGGAGGVGKNGDGGDCASPGVQGKNGGPGGTGGTGAIGFGGDPGKTGLPSELATITINLSITGSAPLLTVATRSGTGGAGGTGGRGGTGGTGGPGGGGATCGCEGTNGGNGGPGGRGGAGGRGGTGGVGTDALDNITVWTPVGQMERVAQFSWPAPPGAGGNPGSGGPGGEGGDGGGQGGASGCPSHPGGTKGGKGGVGDPGLHGNGGTISGNPAKIIVKQA